MARRKRIERRTIRHWSDAEHRKLERYAGRKTPEQIAALLDRTVSAVRQRAAQHRMSLRMKAA